MKREPGLYWIQYGRYWEIAEWRSDGYWWVLGSCDPCNDEDFEEIDETPVTRTT